MHILCVYIYIYTMDPMGIGWYRWYFHQWPQNSAVATIGIQGAPTIEPRFKKDAPCRCIEWHLSRKWHVLQTPYNGFWLSTYNLVVSSPLWPKTTRGLFHCSNFSIPQSSWGMPPSLKNVTLFYCCRGREHPKVYIYIIDQRKFGWETSELRTFKNAKNSVK